jgi:hypothetical protein
MSRCYRGAELSLGTVLFPQNRGAWKPSPLFYRPGFLSGTQVGFILAFGLVIIAIPLGGSWRF